MVEPRAPGEADHFPVGKAGGPKARGQSTVGSKVCAAGWWSRGLLGEADHFPVGKAGDPKTRWPKRRKARRPTWLLRPDGPGGIDARNKEGRNKQNQHNGRIGDQIGRKHGKDIHVDRNERHKIIGRIKRNQMSRPL